MKVPDWAQHFHSNDGEPCYCDPNDVEAGGRGMPRPYLRYSCCSTGQLAHPSKDSGGVNFFPEQAQFLGSGGFGGLDLLG